MLCPFEFLQTNQSSHEAHDRLTSEETARLAAYFCFLWFAANWTLNAALAYTSVASATVLSSMSGECLIVLVSQCLTVIQAYLPWRLAAYFA